MILGLIFSGRKRVCRARCAQLALVILLTFPQALAQVSLQVTDSDSQSWNNGTWSVTLGVPPGATFGPPFVIKGTSTIVPNQQQSGSLNGTGGSSVTLTPNTSISPSGTIWTFNVCPQATSQCFSQPVSITSPTQSVTIAPPGIRIAISPTNVVYRVIAYADSEITNAVPGATYFNPAAGCQKLFIASWSCPVGTGSVSSVGQSTGIVATPNPITGSGTIAILLAFQLPQGCSNNQFPQWSTGGGNWNCATISAGGTVTQVGPGTGIITSPNPIVGSGTVALVASYQLPQSCTNGQVPDWITLSSTWGCVTPTGAPSGPNFSFQVDNGGSFGGVQGPQGTIPLSAGSGFAPDFTGLGYVKVSAFITGTGTITTTCGGANAVSNDLAGYYQAAACALGPDGGIVDGSDTTDALCTGVGRSAADCHTMASDPYENPQTHTMFENSVFYIMPQAQVVDTNAGATCPAPWDGSVAGFAAKQCHAGLGIPNRSSLAWVQSYGAGASQQVRANWSSPGTDRTPVVCMGEGNIGYDYEAFGMTFCGGVNSCFGNGTQNASIPVGSGPRVAHGDWCHFDQGIGGGDIKPSYGVHVINATIKCNDTSTTTTGMTGILNYTAEEDSYAQGGNISGCSKAGIHFTGVGAQNSLILGDWAIYNGPGAGGTGGCTASTVPLLIDGNTENISVKGHVTAGIGGGCNTTPNYLVEVEGQSIDIDRVHCQTAGGGTSICVAAGENTNTAAVRLNEITTGGSGFSYVVEIGTFAQAGVGANGVHVSHIYSYNGSPPMLHDLSVNPVVILNNLPLDYFNVPPVFVGGHIDAMQNTFFALPTSGVSKWCSIQAIFSPATYKWQCTGMASPTFLGSTDTQSDTTDGGILTAITSNSQFAYHDVTATYPWLLAVALPWSNGRRIQTGVTTNQSLVTIGSSPSGVVNPAVIHYAATERAGCLTGGPAQVVLSFVYTDSVGATTFVTIPLLFTIGGHNVVQGVINYMDQGSSAPTYSSTFSGSCSTGTPSYDFLAWVEEEQN